MWLHNSTVSFNFAGFVDNQLISSGKRSGNFEFVTGSHVLWRGEKGENWAEKGRVSKRVEGIREVRTVLKENLEGLVIIM